MTINPQEIQRFDDLAAQWWDPDGAMAPLHRMNPTRMQYVSATLINHFKSLKNINILDVGCGGGLVSEPLARAGANMTGIDGAAELIRIAAQHATQEKLAIDYRHCLTSDLLQENAQFDAILALEVIEHVSDPDAFVAEIAQLLKPGGIVIFSTLNRSAASMLFGVIAAEYIMRWLPVGTHEWRSFMKPSELYQLCQRHDLKATETMGLIFSPVSGEFQLSQNNLSINYFLTATKG